jgi:hypothetical protein
VPDKLERCVSKVKRTVKPRKGQSAEQAAWAICTAALKKRAKKKHK